MSHIHAQTHTHTNTNTLTHAHTHAHLIWYGEAETCMSSLPSLEAEPGTEVEPACVCVVVVGGGDTHGGEAE